MCLPDKFSPVKNMANQPELKEIKWEDMTNATWWRTEMTERLITVIVRNIRIRVRPASKQW